MRVALACIAVAMTPAAADASCFEPSEPYCIRAYGTFDDEFSFNSCRSQLSSYQSEVESYVDCQQREIRAAQQESQDAIETFNQAVAYWNCKAEGASFC